MKVDPNKFKHRLTVVLGEEQGSVYHREMLKTMNVKEYLDALHKLEREIHKEAVEICRVWPTQD